MEGKEFEFAYSGHMKFIASEMTSQNPGLAFRSIVRVQMVDKYNYALKMENLEIATANNRDPKTWQNENALNYEKNSKLSASVERPFIMQFAENNAEPGGLKFHQLEVPALDPLWSVNLKKGLASLLNIFLPTNDAHTYVSQETTIFGNCNAYWNLQHNPHWSNPSAKVFNLTRVINFEECVTVPHKMYGSLKGSACPSCEDTMTHPLETSSKTMYSFVSESGKRSDLILEEVLGYSKIVHSPYTENGNVVSLVSKQNMRLKSTKDVAEKLEIAGDKEIYQNLNTVMERDSNRLRKIDVKSADSFVEDWDIHADEELVISSLKELANKNYFDEHKHHGVFEGKPSSQSLRMATVMMSLLDYNQTQNVFNAIVAAAPEEQKLKMQRLFVQVTAMSGHTSGVVVIIEKFKSGEIDTRFLESFLESFHMGLSDITEMALDTVLDFCKSAQMQKFSQEKKNCFLIYSSLVSEACRFPTAFPQFSAPECAREEFQERAFEKLIPDYETARKDIDNIEMFVNIAANLGTRKSAEFLVKVINDETATSLTKLNAAHGLMKILPKHRDIIQKQAAEIYLNLKQPTELRILSSLILFKSKPALSLLQTLASKLIYQEPNDQVRSFVVSMIKEIDSNDYPCFRGLHQDMRYIAPMVAANLPSEWKRKDFLTSHVKLSTAYDSKFDMGSHSMFSMVMGDSYIPREISYSTGQYFANFLFESSNIVVRQQGMDSMADFIFSPRTMGTAFGTNLWNLAGRRRLTRSADAVKAEMNSIDSSMNLKTKKYEPKRLEVIVGAFGHTLKVMSLNESHLAPFMSPEYTPGTVLNHILSSDVDEVNYSSLRDFSLIMPTSLGFPAWLDVSMPVAFYNQRHNSSFSIEKTGTVKLKVNQHMVVDTTLEETFGFDIAGFRRHLGVGFRKHVTVNAPLHLDVDWSLASGKITFNEEFHLPRDSFQYSFMPHTGQYDFKNASNTYELKLFKEEERKTFEKVIPMGGADLKLKGETLPNDQFSARNLLGWVFDKKFKSKLNELLCNPKWIPRKLAVSFQQAENFILKGQTLSIKHKMVAPTSPEKPKSLFAEHKEDLARSFTHVLQITKQLRGNSDGQADLEFRYSYTPKRDVQWLQVFFARKMPGREHTKMCSISKMERTLTDWSKRTAEDISKINANQKMQVLSDFNYGKECDAESTIHFNLTYDHSSQQKEWLDELTSGTGKTRVHGLKNPYMFNYERCVKWLAKGMVMPIACHKFIIHTSQLNHMILEISGAESKKLENVPLITAAPGFMFSKLGKHLRSIEHLHSPSNRIQIESVVREPCIDQRVADVELQGLHYKLRFDNLPVSWGAHWAPKTATQMGSTNLQSYSRKWYNRYCDHQLNAIRTFDRIFYNVPETTCWKILAEDCSEQKLFTLLTRTTSKGDKDMKLLLDTHKIEITNTGTDILLKIDGAGEEVLQQSKAKVVRNERENLEFVVLHEGPVVIINAPMYGLYILSHSSSVFVQAASFYRGKLCGLCGNFDLNGQNDLHTTDGCHHHTEWSFAQNFVIPDAQCTVPPKASPTEKSNCV